MYVRVSARSLIKQSRQEAAAARAEGLTRPGRSAATVGRSGPRQRSGESAKGQRLKAGQDRGAQPPLAKARRGQSPLGRSPLAWQQAWVASGRGLGAGRRLLGGGAGCKRAQLEGIRGCRPRD